MAAKKRDAGSAAPLKTYVYQVMSGRERTMLDQALRLLNFEEGEAMFLPQAERKRKGKGGAGWITENEILFPGYLFVTTRDVERVTEALRPIIGWKKLLKTGDDIVPLTESEELLLGRLMNCDHLIPSSVAYKEGDQVVIIDGPMANSPGEVVYIDRHKRYAMVKVSMFQREITVKLGIEILSSREEAEALTGEK